MSAATGLRSSLPSTARNAQETIRRVRINRAYTSMLDTAQTPSAAVSLTARPATSPESFGDIDAAALLQLDDALSPTARRSRPPLAAPAPELRSADGSDVTSGPPPQRALAATRARVLRTPVGRSAVSDACRRPRRRPSPRSGARSSTRSSSRWSRPLRQRLVRCRASPWPQNRQWRTTLVPPQGRPPGSGSRSPHVAATRTDVAVGCWRLRSRPRRHVRTRLY